MYVNTHTCIHMHTSFSFYIHQWTFRFFHNSAIVNNVFITWGCVYLFKLVFSFSSDKCPEIELLDCMIVLFLIWGNIILSSIETVPIYISTNSVQGFFFSISLSILFISSLFDNSHSSTWGDNLIMFLISLCLMINEVEHLFMCLLGICMSFLEKCLFRSSHFLITFCVLSCMSSWFILGICKYFLPFSFVDDFLCYTETFILL